jgi:DNA-binding NtrC family response regulator
MGAVRSTRWLASHLEPERTPAETRGENESHVAEASEPEALVRLDDRLLELAALAGTSRERALLLVRTPPHASDAALAIAEHAARRLMRRGGPVVVASACVSQEAFEHAARRLRLDVEVPRSASELRERVVDDLGRQRAALVLLDVPGSTLTRKIVLELASSLEGESDDRVRSHGPIVMVTSAGWADAVPGAERFAVESTIGAAGRERVGAAFAQAFAASTIAALGDALRSARSERLALEAADLTQTPDLARWATRLALVGRSVPTEHAVTLTSQTSPLDAVAQSGSRLASIFTLSEEGVSVDPSWLERADLDVSDDDRRAAARVLLALRDVAAHLRAAELLAAAGDRAQAASVAVDAIARVVDADVRMPLWSRFAALGPFERPEALAAARRALALGDAEAARALSLSAVALASDGEALLVHGAALALGGDAGAAVVVLQRAVVRAESSSIRAAALVELAELALRASNPSEARASATDALEALGDASSTSATEVRLGARNVLGKLLLAEGAFAAAERHFADDAFDAEVARLDSPGLRARVNRAIAAMSSGRRGEAMRLLDDVLTRGRAQGDRRAVGMALANLAACALLEHRYADALRFSEEAVPSLVAAGDRVRLAHAIGNLAELRVQLGLFDAAAQALRFGERAARGAVGSTGHVEAGALGPEVEAQLAVVRGLVAFGRRDTVAAAMQVDAAIAALGADPLRGVPPSRAVKPGEAAESPPNRGRTGRTLGAALRLAAAVALEEGDVSVAERALQRAACEPLTPRSEAELRLLEARWSQAAGAPDDEVRARARRALDAAVVADDDETTREARRLLLELALSSEADPELCLAEARVHARAARLADERVIEGLPDSIVARRRARPELRALERAEARLRERLDRLEAMAPPERSCGGTASDAQPTTTAHGESRGLSVRGAPSLLVGTSTSTRALLASIARAGASDANVLVHGESGTGKELVADALHAASARRDGPLVKVNCAALVETLLLSELFGHEKGAFTGAVSRRRGRFEQAEGGTLFLDEIGDITPRTQVALLRVLQERTFERVGGSTPVRCDVRLVFATHRDLPALVASGAFREDLYYRIRALVLEVRPLRERLDDLGPIADALLTRAAAERRGGPRRLGAGVLELLRAHPWPGNVRELDNVLRAADVFADGPSLEVADIVGQLPSLAPHAARLAGAPRPAASPVRPELLTHREGGVALAMVAGEQDDPSISAPDPAGVAYAHIRSGTSLHDLKRRIERDCIAKALADAGSNITRAAALLGMKRPRLSQLVKQYRLGTHDDELDDDASLPEDDET